MPADQRPSLRPRQGRGVGRARAGRPDHRLGDRHCLARGRPALNGAQTEAMGVGIGVSLARDRADVRAALVSAPGDRAHRIGRDQDRQCPLQVRPDAQRRGDRRAGARSGAAHCRRRRAVRDRHRPVAAVGRVAGVERSRRPADGPRMAGGRAAGSSSRPRELSGARRAFTTCARARAAPALRPVPRLGSGRLDGAGSA